MYLRSFCTVCLRLSELPVRSGLNLTSKSSLDIAEVAVPPQIMTNGFPEDTPTHYQVLDLPWNVGLDSEISAQHLKVAYRRALLQHHPDKTGAKSGSEHELEARKNSGKGNTYTIDQVTEAYATLSVPKLRFEYDQVLRLRARHLTGTGQAHDKFRSGLEVADLEDFDYDETGEVWFKSCRCGDERGFQMQEGDLEEASDIGELHVGCRGCSLWVMVLFGVIENKDKDHVKESCEQNPTSKGTG